MNTVAASVLVLRWAEQRARLRDHELVAWFPKLPLWLTGEAQPTLRQLEDFAHRTRTAFGYFFLPQPPVLALPVQDFRTLRDAVLAEPSSDLLGLSAEARRQLPGWADALRQLIAQAEDAGVLVMVSSVVGSNSPRKLDAAELRGFALADALAPLVFLNGSDSKAAQMFTLAHELAHVWLGATGVSDTQAGQVPEQQTERWCNRVAAELPMPMDELRAVVQHQRPVADEIQRLAREFKVSTLVALRCLFDGGFTHQTALWQHYREEQDRLRTLQERATSGGDYYRSLGARTSKRFARALVSSTLEGLTSFPDAFRMLGVRKTAALDRLAHPLNLVGGY